LFYIYSMLKNIILVGLGGFAGSILRYAASLAALKIFSTSFPAGTFIVNISGCLLAGILFGMFEKEIIGQNWRLFLAIGFCGGFTTFSAFAFESVYFLRSDHLLHFFIYLALSILVGLACMYGGIMLGKSL
jgi:fluoride exporter